MKSQRRHELEQNELAQWLGDVAKTIKPYQNLILGMLLVVLVGTAAYAVWSRQSGSRSAAAWTALFEAVESNDPFQFDDVITDYEGTRAAECAAVMAGDIHLSEGCRLLFENKANANQELRRATEYYMSVLETSEDPSLRERATFGLARALEAQARDLDEAIARYSEVVENWPDGPFAMAAQRRIEDLKRAETRAMYDRFARFDPKPAFSDEPGVPGQRPPFDLDNIPEDSSLFTPSSPFGGSSPETTPDDGSSVPIELPGMPAEPAGESTEPAGEPAQPTGEPSPPAGESTEPAGESTSADATEQPAAGAESTGAESSAGSADPAEQPGRAQEAATPEAAPPSASGAADESGAPDDADAADEDESGAADDAGAADEDESGAADDAGAADEDESGAADDAGAADESGAAEAPASTRADQGSADESTGVPTPKSASAGDS